MIKKFTLSNGITIPAIGYGTWRIPDGCIAAGGVKMAVCCGYQHIDTAAAYGNEQSIGRGIAECSVGRKELFVTGKLSDGEWDYENVIESFYGMLRDLEMDYLDLCLVQRPNDKNLPEKWKQFSGNTWRALTDLYKTGKAYAIGVSDFTPHHLDQLIMADVPPMVNQIRFYPGHQKLSTVEYCRKHNILIETYSPFGTGSILKDPVLMEIAQKYQKSAAQICIRWCLQHEVLPLPKSITPSRIQENLQVFDFVISSEDIKRIDKLKEL